MIPTPIIPPELTASVSAALMRADIGKDFFSSVLQTQTVIFGLIVTILTFILAFLIPRSLKGQVETEVKKELAITRGQLEIQQKEFKEKQLETNNQLKKDLSEEISSLESRLRSDLKNYEAEMNVVKSETYRVMAQFHESKNFNSSAFIWFLRAAIATRECEDLTMTRAHLLSSIKNLAKITDGETQLLFQDNIMPDWNDFLKNFKAEGLEVEVRQVKEAFETALKRKPQAILPLVSNP